MLLAGRRLDAEAALACGLVADVVPAEELTGAAHRLIDRMARQSATALRLTKLVVDSPAPTRSPTTSRRPSSSRAPTSASA